MDELDEFIKVLRGECQVLIRAGKMMPDEPDAWRFYSPPLDGEYESDHLRAVLNAGKLTLIAEEYYSDGDSNAAFIYLAKAQAALLKSISSIGKAESKKLGRSRGGQSRDESIRKDVIYIADDLLNEGAAWRGLASKVAIKLSENGDELREGKIKQILDDEKSALLER